MRHYSDPQKMPGTRGANKAQNITEANEGEVLEYMMPKALLYQQILNCELVENMFLNLIRASDACEYSTFLKMPICSRRMDVLRYPTYHILIKGCSWYGRVQVQRRNWRWCLRTWAHVWRAACEFSLSVPSGNPINARYAQFNLDRRYKV